MTVMTKKTVFTRIRIADGITNNIIKANLLLIQHKSIIVFNGY